MAADQFGRVLRFLRLINSKTIKLKIFTYPSIVRSKLQILLFLISYKLAGLLSLKKDKFPKIEEKFVNKNNILDEVIIFDNKLEYDEVNIFLRGFGKDFTKFKNKKNCMLVNYAFLKSENMNEYEHYHDERKLFEAPNGSIHVGSGYEVDECMEKNIPFILLQRYHLCDGKPVLIDPKQIEKNLIYENYVKKNNHSKIIKFYFNSSCKTIRSGSGLHAALIFSKISKKVNIYGWNFYFDKISKNNSIFTAYNLLSPKKFVSSRKNHFEYTLCNLAFIKKLLNCDHVNIEGYLKEYCNHYPNIASKALKVFF